MARSGQGALLFLTILGLLVGSCGAFWTWQLPLMGPGDGLLTDPVYLFALACMIGGFGAFYWAVRRIRK